MLDRFPTRFVESIFDALGDIVYCVKDREGCYRSVNLAFAERVDAQDKSEMIGKKASDFFPADLADVYAAQDETVFTKGHAIQDQLERITHRDGSMGWFLTSKFPVRSETDEVVALVGISQDLHTPNDRDLQMANLKTIVDFIKQNLHQQLKVEKLAERFAMSQVQLDRRMKRIFRLSTKKFIMKCRLEEASRRLVSTDDALSSIALACGFSDQSAFTRQFRAAANLAPLGFRKKHSGEKE